MPGGHKALCSRCGKLLYKHIPDSVERTLALAIGGLILFTIANTLPFIKMSIGAQASDLNLISGLFDLYEHRLRVIVSVVFFTCILAPLLQLLAILYVFLPLHVGRRAVHAPLALRALFHLREWSMVEVFLLGILVSVVKLASMATIVPGIALWSFVAMIFCLTGAISSIDSHVVWQRLEEAK